MKKFLALLLALTMVISLAACGSKPAEPAPAPAPEAPAADAPAAEAPAAPAADLPVIKMWFHGSNVQPDASAKVMAELNKVLAEKIGCTLEPIWGTWGDFDDSVRTALAAGGDGVDIYFTCTWSSDEYNQYARDGYWVKLDDLMDEYAPELKATLPEGIWEGAKTDGAEGRGVYAVPGLKDSATQNVWDINCTRLAELGFDVDAITSKPLDYFSDEFESMLAAAKKEYGADFYPLLIEPAVLERMVNHSTIVTGDIASANVLSFYYDAEHPSKDIGSQFVNKYATPEFAKYAERTYEYAKKGYISPQSQNIGTSNDYLTSARLEGAYLIGTQVYAYGYEKTVSAERNIEVRMVPETAPYMDCVSSQGAMMAISTASKNPELALKFLNLLNTDPAIMTMVNYGLEGFTYTKNADGTISFTEERANYSPWTNGVGNVYILPDTAEEGVGFRQDFANFYSSGESVPYGGFAFNNSDYQNEVTSIGTVAAQYSFDLLSGAVNPKTELPKFLKALEGAGINEFVAAVNEQWQAMG